MINYVKPYIRSLQLGPDTVYVRAMSASDAEIVINEKIKELQPYLQDNDVGEQLEIEGDKETTIIEIMSGGPDITNDTKHDNSDTESFQANIRKYKNMRNRIKWALERESVSVKTIKIVTRTLDDMIATLVRRQCPQELQNRNVKNPLKFKTDVYDYYFSNITYDSNNQCYVGKEKLSEENCKMLKEPFKHCMVAGKKISEKDCKKLFEWLMPRQACYEGDETLSPEQCKILHERNITNSFTSHESFKKQIHTLFPTISSQLDDIYNAFTKSLTNIRKDSHMPDNFNVKCTLIDLNKDKTIKTVKTWIFVVTSEYVQKN